MLGENPQPISQHRMPHRARGEYAKLTCEPATPLNENPHRAVQDGRPWVRDLRCLDCRMKIESPLRPRTTPAANHLAGCPLA